MAFGQWLAVGIGAALGAWIRWGLGVAFNASILPIGTLIVNLVGGLLMGISLAYFVTTPSQNELRLFVMTGFLGGLTTFSAFSAEAYTLLSKHEYAWASAHIFSHVIGSLLMTALGFWLMNIIRN
jgi:fluoride exporter